MSEQMLIESTVRREAGYIEQPCELRSRFADNGRHQWRLATAKDRAQLQADRAAADEAILRAYWDAEAAKGFPVAPSEQDRQRQLMALSGTVAVVEHIMSYSRPQIVRTPQPIQRKGK